MSYINAAPIVLDCGSAMCKAGFAGEDCPRLINSSVIGRPKFLSKGTTSNYLDDRSYYVGDAAQSKRAILNLRYPVEEGVIKHWEDMEKIWNHIFYERLRVSPEEHKVLITEALFSPIKNEDKIFQVMFEAFSTPAVHIAYQPVLSLFASGRTTGLVLESGAGITNAVPIYQGIPLSDAVSTTEVSGIQITDYLMTLLSKHGYCMDSYIAQDIKEKLCYVALDFKEETQTADSHLKMEKGYELPDGSVINVSRERCQCPEMLFQPSLFGVKSTGVHETLVESIIKTDMSIHKTLYNNIVLSGGNTLFQGFPDRIRKEITEMAPPTKKTRIIAPPERQYSAWIGGSILASLPSFQERWISKMDYSEYGENITHRIGR